MTPKKKKPVVTRTVHLLPFRALGWEQFEQLTLRLVLKNGYQNAEHYGATGNDGARDIVDLYQGAYFQCKNQARFPPLSVREEVEKLKQHDGVSRVVFVIGGRVSAKSRDLAHKLLGGIPCEFWCESKLDAMVKDDPEILRDFFDYPEPRNDIKAITEKRSVRITIGTITVDQTGRVIDKDAHVAELISELVVTFEDSRKIGRIDVQLKHLQAIEEKLEQKKYQSADHKVYLNRCRKDLMDLAKRIERGVTLLALSSRYSLSVSEKATICRTVVRQTLELGGFVDEPSKEPPNSRGHTIEIFARPSPYPRQLQVETTRQEIEDIQERLGFPVCATVMNGQSCSLLPSEFLWFRAYPIMIVATVWFRAYPCDDSLAAEKCDYDNWLFGLA